jgi:histidine triad (HIT) family protein
MNDINCIFCQIVQGKIPSFKVYEDEHFLAFLDINPKSPGHTQVVPKKHYRWVWDAPNVGAYFEVVKKIAQAQQKAFDQESIWSRVTGEDVSHAHIWIFPDPRHTSGDAKDFELNAKKIRDFMGGTKPLSQEGFQ